MAKKITELLAASSVSDTDVVPVVDVATGVTKKVTVALLRGLSGVNGVLTIPANQIVYSGNPTVDRREKDRRIGPIDTPRTIALYALDPNDVRQLDLTINFTTQDGSHWAIFNLRPKVRRPPTGDAILLSGGTDPSPERSDASIDAYAHASGASIMLTVTPGTTGVSVNVSYWINSIKGIWG